jgi:hypothetical protein
MSTAGPARGTRVGFASIAAFPCPAQFTTRVTSTKVQILTRVLVQRDTRVGFASITAFPCPAAVQVLSLLLALLVQKYKY